MTTLTVSRTRELLQAISGQRIGLIGDLFLDRYFEIDPALDEPSIETGLTAYQVTRVRNQPGALGTVMANLAALGVAQLVPVTVIGDDGLGYDLRTAISELPVAEAGVLQDAERRTPTYIKPVRKQQDGTFEELNRLDVRTRAPLRPAMIDRLIERIDALWDDADGWIVLDQIGRPDEGVVHRCVREHIESYCRKDGRHVVVIDSREQLGAFRAGILKGNDAEFCRAAGEPLERVGQAARNLARRTGRHAFCTCGAAGIRVADPAGDVTCVPGVPVEGPIDIVGAGDSATAAITTGLVAGASPEEAAAFANVVASITVRQIGTTGTASPSQIIEQVASSGADR